MSSELLDASRRGDDSLMQLLLRQRADVTGTVFEGRVRSLSELSDTLDECVSVQALRSHLLDLEGIAPETHVGTASSLTPSMLFQTEACAICGGHERGQDLVEKCCVHACAACAENRFRGNYLPCPRCWTCGFPGGYISDEEPAANFVPLLVLLDLNGVLCHRGRDGLRLGCPLALNLHPCPSMVANCVALEAPFSTVPSVEAIMLDAGNQGFKSWMYVDQEQCNLIHYLDRLAREDKISWGVYTTIGKGRTGTATPMLHDVLRRAGFDDIREGPEQHIVHYTDPATRKHGKMWFFTQDDLCEFDNSLASARFANTKRPSSLHSPDVVAKVNSITNQAVVNRSLIVVGNAKKAKLIHDICLLVPDYNSCAVWSGTSGLSRVRQVVDAVLPLSDCRPFLRQTNRRFVLAKMISESACSCGFPTIAVDLILEYSGILQM